MEDNDRGIKVVDFALPASGSLTHSVCTCVYGGGGGGGGEVGMGLTRKRDVPRLRVLRWNLARAVAERVAEEQQEEL